MINNNLDQVQGENYLDQLKKYFKEFWSRSLERERLKKNFKEFVLGCISGLLLLIMLAKVKGFFPSFFKMARNTCERLLEKSKKLSSNIIRKITGTEQLERKKEELEAEVETYKNIVLGLRLHNIFLTEQFGKQNDSQESGIKLDSRRALGILKIDDPNPSQAEISGAYRNVVARFHPNSAPVEQSAKEELLSKNLHHLSAHSLYEIVQEASKGEGIYIDKLFKSTAEKIVFEATQAKDFLTDYEDKVRQMDRERREQNKEELSR